MGMVIVRDSMKHKWHLAQRNIGTSETLCGINYWNVDSGAKTGMWEVGIPVDAIAAKTLIDCGLCKRVAYRDADSALWEW